MMNDFMTVFTDLTRIDIPDDTSSSEEEDREKTPGMILCNFEIGTGTGSGIESSLLLIFVVSQLLHNAILGSYVWSVLSNPMALKPPHVSMLAKMVVKVLNGQTSDSWKEKDELWWEDNIDRLPLMRRSEGRGSSIDSPKILQNFPFIQAYPSLRTPTVQL